MTTARRWGEADLPAVAVAWGRRSGDNASTVGPSPGDGLGAAGEEDGDGADGRRTAGAPLCAVEGWTEPEPSLPDGRFVLRGRIWGGDVICTLAPDRPDLIEGKWGRRAPVSGRVTRERDTDRPLRVGGVTHITLLPEVEPGSLLRAAGGIAPAPPGAEPPEVRTRRLRDSWDG